ncbi:TetR/AcrR family transcriptional regulator [Mycolicibacterium wolinskyi]|nr:TetR/AcrR family transcriptional regulator [Mycolicibacterium wolinskyi]
MLGDMTTAKRQGRPPAAEAPAALSDILSKALKMFAENGFDGTSVAALNRELGVSHNLIHQRFGSKEGLWYAAVDFAFGEVHEQISVDTELAERDLMEAARQTIVRFLVSHAHHPELLRLVTVEGATPSPRLTYLHEVHVQPLYARLTEPLKVLVNCGALNAADVRSLHFLVAHGGTAPFSLVPFALMLEPHDPTEPAAIEHHAEFVADMLIAGLRARVATKGTP